MNRVARRLALAAVLALAPREAAAQVRWDAELAGGAMRRVLSSKPAGGDDAGFGPLLEASAHVALLPLLRVGLYGHYDASPVSGQVTRDLYAGGLDGRLTLPWLRGDVRAYVRLGIGEAGTYSASHALAPSPRASSFVPSASGNFTEVPLAVGASYRVAPQFWVGAEAGARFGFAFAGSAYDGSRTSGDDSVAAFLDLGVMWGR